MGLWSKIKKAVKKAVKAVVRVVKTVARVALKAVTGFIMRVVHSVGEVLTLGKANKNVRMQVFVLRDEMKSGVIDPALFVPAVERAKKIFKDEFNVTLKSYGRPEIQVLPDPAPAGALDVDCDAGAFAEEFGEAGDYFAKNTAGWVAIPISLSFPLTVFVVRSIVDKIGCSIPITDYVTIAATAPGGVGESGVASQTTLTHELAHSCLLGHRDDQKNLMFASRTRGTATTWWQRRVLRTSRHCTFW